MLILKRVQAILLTSPLGMIWSTKFCIFPELQNLCEIKRWWTTSWEFAINTSYNLRWSLSVQKCQNRQHVFSNDENCTLWGHRKQHFQWYLLFNILLCSYTMAKWSNIVCQTFEVFFFEQNIWLSCYVMKQCFSNSRIFSLQKVNKNDLSVFQSIAYKILLPKQMFWNCSNDKPYLQNKFQMFEQNHSIKHLVRPWPNDQTLLVKHLKFDYNARLFT